MSGSRTQVCRFRNAAHTVRENEDAQTQEGEEASNCVVTWAPRTRPLTHFEEKNVVVINKRKMEIYWWDLEMWTPRFF